MGKGMGMGGRTLGAHRLKLDAKTHRCKTVVRNESQIGGCSDRQRGTEYGVHVFVWSIVCTYMSLSKTRRCPRTAQPGVHTCNIFIEVWLHKTIVILKVLCST